MNIRATSVLALIASAFMAMTCVAEDKADAPSIDKLIKKLGSDRYRDRQQATQEIDELGGPALKALRKAMESPDAEIKKRAAELVSRIEKRVETQEALTATTVKLAMKDAPVAKVVAELARQSGYQIDLKNVRERRISIDTGETTFWQAFDKVCDTAGLKEDSEPKADDAKDARNEKEAIKRQLIQRMRGMQPQALTSTKLTLVDGRAELGPTCYVGAVRIRVLPGVERRGKDEIVVKFQIDAEPKLRWTEVPTLNIEKALDDNGQELMALRDDQAVGNINRGNIVIMNGRMLNEPTMDGGVAHVVTTVRFKAANPPGKLAEVTGTVAGPVDTPTQPLVTVDDVMKQVGKTIKGAKGCALTVKEATEANGRTQLRIAVTDPANAQNGFAQLGNAQVQIRIAANGQAIVMPAGGNGSGMLELLDAEGKAMLARDSQRPNIVNNKMEFEHTLQLLQPNSKPAKLIYRGSRTTEVNVPFTLEKK